MKPSLAIILVLLALVMLYAAWTVWRPVWHDWAMAARGVTVLATVTEVVPGPAGGADGVHFASVTVPRPGSPPFLGRVRGYRGRGFAVGDQVPLRYLPTEPDELRLADRWLWKAAAASLSAHVVLFILALGMTLVGLGMLARVVVDAL